MTVGLLLPRGSGPSDLARAGQWPRFSRAWLRAYAAAFERVVLLIEEDIDPARCGLADGVEVRRLAAARTVRRRWQGAAFADLDVVRAFQAPDLAGIPRPGPPAAATFGFDYDRLALLERRPLRALRAACRARSGARRASLLFAPAPFLEAQALRVAPGARTEILPNGVDLEAFAPPERLRPPRRALCVGRLERQKDLATLLRALALLPDGRRPALTLVGGGSERGGLETLARRLGVPVEFTGPLPHDQLPGIVAAHDLFLLPSLAEGQPKALIEAMAGGLACLVSDCQGNRALIEDGRTGWLHPVGDPAALASALERIGGLGEADLFRVRRAARRAAEEHHDLRALVAREVRLVAEIAGREAGGDLDAKYRRTGAYHWRETDPRHLADFNAPLRARYRAILSMAPPRSSLALDAGCGDGVLSSRLLRRAGRVVGCDPSRRALSLARARVRDRTSWVCGRLEALPFRPGAFDLAVAADVLEHADDAGTAAAELCRVLSPAGCLMASAPVAKPGAPPGRFHRREFGLGDLQALLSGCFERRRERRSHAGWLLRLYESRLLGRPWPKRIIDILEVAGIDLFGWPAGGGARQATWRGRPRPLPGDSGAVSVAVAPGRVAPASPPATSASAAQVAGAMNRKCG